MRTSRRSPPSSTRRPRMTRPRSTRCAGRPRRIRARPASSLETRRASGRDRLGRPDLRLPAGLRRVLGDRQRRSPTPAARGSVRPCSRPSPSVPWPPARSPCTSRHRMAGPTAIDFLPPPRVPRVRAQQVRPPRTRRPGAAGRRPAGRRLADDARRTARSWSRASTRWRSRPSPTSRAATPRWRPATWTSSGRATWIGRRSRPPGSSSPPTTPPVASSATPACCSSRRTGVGSRGTT